MFGILKITCEQAHKVCNKAQYKEAIFKEKLKLSLHILFCKSCALYVKQNSLVSSVCKSISDDKICTKSMSKDKKDKLQEIISEIDF